VGWGGVGWGGVGWGARLWRPKPQPRLPCLSPCMCTGDRYKSIELPLIGSKCLAVMDWPFGMSSNMDMSVLPPNFRAGVLDVRKASCYGEKERGRLCVGRVE
jgi:hypothetical protein